MNVCYITKVSNRDFTVAACLFCLAIYAAVSTAYLYSGVFIVGYLLNDTLLYTESAYRVAFGQMPGIDFTDPLGIFSYLPLAVVYKFTGDLARSIPISFVFYGFLVFLAASYLSLTRLRLTEGCAIALTCSILTASPWVLGYDSGNSVNPMSSAAMYYNKFGFSLVLITALFVIPAKPEWRAVSLRCDGITAGLIFLLAYYTKMPFGLGIIALFVLWRVWIAPHLLGLATFGTIATLGAALVEITKPGLNFAYLSENRFASSAAGGALQVSGLIGHSLHVVPEIVILAVLPTALGLITNRIDRRYVVFLFCFILGSLVLRAQSAQGHVLYTTLAVPVIVLSLLNIKPSSDVTRVASWAISLAFLYGVLQFLSPPLVVIARHVVEARRLQPIPNVSSRYAALRTPNLNSLSRLNQAFTNQLNGAEAFAAARQAPAQDLFSPLSEEEYVTTLTDLPIARELCGSAKDKTAIIDYANVASSYLGHPPVAAYTYAHIGRSYSQNTHLQPELMFRGVRCIFLPKLPKDPEQRDGLMQIYGSFIHDHFEPAGETKFWRVLLAPPH